MKNLLVILFSLFAFSIFAQTDGSYVNFVADTTTDTETEYLVLASPRTLTKNYIVTICVTPANVASGTATVLGMPQGSLDGTTFYDLQAASDTVNNAGTIAAVKYEYLNAYWRFYRYKMVSSGTGGTIFNGQIGIKRK